MTEVKNINQSPSKDLPRWIRGYLGREDLEAIETKIGEIERSTAGELVLVIARRSFNWRLHYPIVTLFLLLLFMLFFEDEFMSWFDYQFIITSVWAELGLKLSLFLVILLMSNLLSKIGFISRLTTPREIRRKMAEARAELEFFRSGIKATKAATGILVFLAIDDRQAVILADKAISSKLPPDTWDHILAELLMGIKSKKARDGILKAVEMSGTILQEHFPIGPGDTNELQNHVVIID
jgi:putative membrane protein